MITISGSLRIFAGGALSQYIDGNTNFVGIGRGFSNPQALLHVSSTNFISTGEVFRTDGPSTDINAWRLWTGTGANASEKAAFYIPANSNNFVLQATHQGSNMIFNTGGANQRMKIDSVGTVTINSLASNSQTLVIANKNGTLTTADTETILTQSKTIAQLQQKIETLEKTIAEIK